MANSFRKCLRFDAQSQNYLKEIYEKDNSIAQQTGREKLSENQIVMDALYYYYKNKYCSQQMKKEAEEEKIFYAKLNDKILSKYFNLMMDLLEAEVERINDLKLQISLLSSKEGTYEDVSKKGILRIIEDLNDDEELFRKIKKEYKKANPEILYEADIKKENKEEKEDDREFF